MERLQSLVDSPFILKINLVRWSSALKCPYDEWLSVKAFKAISLVVAFQLTLPLQNKECSAPGRKDNVSCPDISLHYAEHAKAVFMLKNTISRR
jgi:hypothetical protein